MYKLRKIALAIIFFTCFLASMFGLFALPNYHAWFDPCEESKVVRTMMAKDYDGLWARGGFIASAWNQSEDGCYKTKEDYRELQKRGKTGLEKYHKTHPPYISAPGLDTLLVYPFWRLSQIIAENSKDRIYIGLWTMRAVAAISIAISISLLCLWITREVNLFSGLVVAAATILSPIAPTLIYNIGRSVLYKPFFWFLPFLVVAFLMQSNWRKKNKAKYDWKTLAVIALSAAVAICAKILFGLGYDMLPTVMVATTIPIFWYAVKEKWQIKKFLLWNTVCSCAIVLGFLSAFALHHRQASAIGFDFLAHAKHRFILRTQGASHEFVAGLKEMKKIDCSKKYNKFEIEWAACENPWRLLLLSFAYQIPATILLILLLINKRIRIELKARLKNPQTRRIWLAILAAIAIAAIAAASQPLILKQATKTHWWWKVGAWLMFFRPFLFLAIAFLIEPIVARWSAKVTTAWNEEQQKLQIRKP